MIAEKRKFEKKNQTPSCSGRKRKRKKEIPEGECVTVKIRPQFGLQDATCLHEVGITSNRLPEGRNKKNKRKRGED